MHIFQDFEDDARVPSCVKVHLLVIRDLADLAASVSERSAGGGGLRGAYLTSLYCVGRSTAMAPP